MKWNISYAEQSIAAQELIQTDDSIIQAAILLGKANRLCDPECSW